MDKLDRRHKLLYVVTALGVITVLGLLFVQQDGSAPVNSPENTSDENLPLSGEVHTVEFDGQSFEPSTLRIDRGDTVEWVNTGDTFMWVASDRHPAHKSYDGSSLREHCPDGDSFDQCGDSGNYSFTFGKTGTFGYHNHQPFVRGGEIIVE